LSGITIANRARSPRLDGRRLKPLVRRVLAGAGFERPLSLVLVDDREMRELNRRFLDHDEPTDVLAFPFDPEVDGIGGEVVVSVETAAREATARRLPFERELLLYVAHGVLHLTGLEDHTPEGRKEMDRAATVILDRLGEVPSIRADGSRA
jgi:probable rRNA maturation factor